MRHKDLKIYVELQVRTNEMHSSAFLRGAAPVDHPVQEELLLGLTAISPLSDYTVGSRRPFLTSFNVICFLLMLVQASSSDLCSVLLNNIYSIFNDNTSTASLEESSSATFEGVLPSLYALVEDQIATRLLIIEINTWLNKSEDALDNNLAFGQISGYQSYLENWITTISAGINLFILEPRNNSKVLRLLLLRCQEACLLYKSCGGSLMLHAALCNVEAEGNHKGLMAGTKNHCQWQLINSLFLNTYQFMLLFCRLI